MDLIGKGLCGLTGECGRWLVVEEVLPDELLHSLDHPVRVRVAPLQLHRLSLSLLFLPALHSTSDSRSRVSDRSDAHIVLSPDLRVERDDRLLGLDELLQRLGRQLLYRLKLNFSKVKKNFKEIRIKIKTSL